MKIWLGQGNPGPKYAGNRHNVGFMIMDALATHYNFSPWRTKFQSRMALGEIGGVKTLLLKPETYYNESGRAAHEAMRFYKITAEDFAVFHDEIDLTPGRMRTKLGGGHAGNNGLRSLLAHLDGDFYRVRVGVGHPGNKAMVNPHVLSDFHKVDMDWLAALIDAIVRSAPLLAQGNMDAFQSDVMRLAPPSKP